MIYVFLLCVCVCVCVRVENRKKEKGEQWRWRWNLSVINVARINSRMKNVTIIFYSFFFLNRFFFYYRMIIIILLWLKRKHCRLGFGNFFVQNTEIQFKWNYRNVLYLYVSWIIIIRKILNKFWANLLSNFTQKKKKKEKIASKFFT